MAVLGHFPRHVTADAAYDARSRLPDLAYRNGIGAISLNQHGHPDGPRDRDWARLICFSLSIDYAHCIKWLVDSVYPHAEDVRIVQDNLNTHTAALYEAFEPVEARRILQRVEFHHTPKHGSWLNMAQIEMSIFAPSITIWTDH